MKKRKRRAKTVFVEKFLSLKKNTEKKGGDDLLRNEQVFARAGRFFMTKEGSQRGGGGEISKPNPFWGMKLSEKNSSLAPELRRVRDVAAS